MPLTIHIGHKVLSSLIAHAQIARPHECCGLLVGRRCDGLVLIDAAIRSPNISQGNRRRRYQVDWGVLLATSRRSREVGRQIVGVYHSHPNGSSVLSARDRRLAWPDHTYMVLGMLGRQCAAITCWRVLGHRSRCVEEPIKLLESGEASPPLPPRR